MSNCALTYSLRADGHPFLVTWLNVGIGVSVAADCGSKVRSFGQWAADNCVALPTANIGQYSLGIVNGCCSGVPV